MTRVPVHHFETLESTNVTAKALAEQGEAAPFWVVADEQTGGRGRRARVWVSPKGNLYCTGLYPAFADMAQTAQLSFAAAIAAAESLETRVSADSIRIKWPNDVQVGGAKISGLLLETYAVGGAPYVAVGIGINIASSPKKLGQAVTHLGAHTDTRPTPRELLDVLTERFAYWYAQLQRYGFETLRKAWTLRAIGLGGPVTCRLVGRDVSGTAIGLSPKGELQLRLDNGTVEAISSGEVFFHGR